MDQVKAQLAVVMKYGFWISSAIVLIGSVGIWYVTTGALLDEYDSQASKIQGAISQVDSTRDELPEQPNDHSHVIMEQMIEARRDEVLKSWQTLYDRQQAILKWPSGVFTDDLLAEYKDKTPIEIFIEHPTEERDELETTLRSQYATYIRNVLPDIAAIGGTEWTAEFESSGMAMGMMDGMGGMGDMAMMMGGGDDVDITGAAEGPLVTWGSSSQQSVLADLFPWRGSLPTTLEVYYSQENLWILRQLMQIVHDVNGDVTQSYQAKIREIQLIGIGKSVQFGAGAISEPGSSASSGMMGGMSMEMGMEMGMDMSDMDMDMGEGGDVGPSPDPADDRYLNASREPITGQTLRSALTSKSPTDAPLAVAKRVPVKMTLIMDQRAVSDLVAACGSAELMVEVNQVRVLPKDAGGAGGMMGGMMGGMGEMGGDMGGDMEMDDMEGGMGGMMGGGPGGMMGGMPGAGGVSGKPADEFPLDMYVEVYGIIYIYNPPDGEKLGVEQITEDTDVEGVTGGQSTSADTDTTTPAGTGDGTTPPTDGELPQPGAGTPAGGTTTPPDDGTTTPPDSSGTAPSGATTPPADGTTTPPGTPPADASGTPPAP